ncbi:MAG: ankyrin repeat domain-containing protein [Rickettsiales bacterium]|nr:ankyrin repeat domain-containing protein [Rickettsiales bacterium]
MTNNLIALILTNKINEIKKFIAEGGDVNLRDEWGLTPLIAATLCNDPAIVKILLRAGAKLDLQNNEGKTALDIAKEYDYQKIIELLTTKN